MTLYLKYRPQKLEDLDLTPVREQLINIVKQDNFPHAFLFCGPKGTGKTSSARILAKVINCEHRKRETVEPCDKCDQCLSIMKGANIDVIEMDAASNRGIDDIRSLRENIALSPVRAHKKIYIIDEVHMLTTEAANAFLKTLEEPPTHVIFILATTNPEKLPATVHSRLMSVVFRKANDAEIERQIKRVVSGENLKIDDGVATVIAKASDGSFRDAAKILESLNANLDKITVAKVNEFLFQSEILQVDRLIKLFLEGSLKESLEEVERVVAGGGSMKTYIDSMLGKLHQDLLSSPSPQTLQLIELLIQARTELSLAVMPQLPLEIAVCKWFFSKGEVKTVSPKNENVFEKKTEKVAEKRGSVEAVDINTELWQKFLVSVKEKNASIEALLRAAKPVNFDGQTLTLGVYYQFHKERLEVGQNRRTLEEVLQIILGSPIRVECKLTERPKQTKIQKEVLQDASDQDIIKAAKEIFGN